MIHDGPVTIRGNILRTVHVIGVTFAGIVSHETHDIIADDPWEAVNEVEGKDHLHPGPELPWPRALICSHPGFDHSLTTLERGNVSIRGAISGPPMFAVVVLASDPGVGRHLALTDELPDGIIRDVEREIDGTIMSFEMDQETGSYDLIAVKQNVVRNTRPMTWSVTTATTNTGDWRV